jgi:hypothetical protein
MLPPAAVSTLAATMLNPMFVRSELVCIGSFRETVCRLSEPLPDNHERCRDALPDAGGQLRRIEVGPHLNVSLTSRDGWSSVSVISIKHELLTTAFANVVSPAVHLLGPQAGALAPGSSGLLSRRFEDQPRDFVGMGNQREMAGMQLDGLGAHPLGHEALKVRIDGAVFR